jgi:hypothetical protein
VDSDFSVDLDKRMPLTAYVFIVDGGDVSFKETLHPIVSHSTTEVEYMAIVEACKEYVWLECFYAELCGDGSCINLFFDGQSAMYLPKMKCSMRGQSTLMQSTIISATLMNKVN